MSNQQKELSLLELLLLVAEASPEEKTLVNIHQSLNIKNMDEKLKCHSSTPIDGWKWAGEVIGKGATGYVSPDYKIKVQDYVRSLGLSIYKTEEK